MYNYEIYKLTLEHYININEEHRNIEEPLVVQMVIDRTDTPTPVCLNAMIDRMKDEILIRARRE